MTILNISGNGPKQEGYKKLTVYHPYPKHERTKFNNSILPGMYHAAYHHLQSKFETYFVKESKSRFNRKKKIDNWEAKFTFWTSKNPASFSNFLEEAPILNPEKLQKCKEAITLVTEQISEIQREVTCVQESYSEITHSVTGELRKFATEQQKYNEEQINILLALKNNHLQVKEKLVVYKEKIEASFVITNNSEKRSKNSRKRKDNRQKGKRWKCRRKESGVIAFLNQALLKDVKQVYFGSAEVSLELLNELPEPITTCWLDMSKFNDLKHKQKRMVYEFINGKHWFAIDVINFMETSMLNDE